ncbi:MAG: MarR family transcriptional regulator [Cryobacterium sp.]|nr:MarR family transcriptional regulator [Oligoflexia bacterium]
MRIEWKEIPKEETIFKIASKYPGVSPKAFEAYLKMMWLSAQTERVMDTHFNEWGLSRGRFMLLMMLYGQCHLGFSANGEPGPAALSPSELASQLDVTRGNMTGLIDGLEREGWIRRESQPDDRRGLLIVLTDEGSARLEKLLPIHFQRMGRFLSKLSAGEAEGMLVGVQRLLSGLNGVREELEAVVKEKAKE